MFLKKLYKEKLKEVGIYHLERKGKGRKHDNTLQYLNSCHKEDGEI